MAFRFTEKRGVARQVRAIAAEQVAKAVAAAQASTDVDATVHQMRRRCKKLRGLLRLIEPQFADFSIENAAVRDAAALLGGTRDAAVLLQTFDALPLAEQGEDTAIAAIRGILAERGGSLPGPVTQRELLGKVAGQLAAVGERSAGWKVRGRKFPAVSGGLELTYRRLRKAMKAAVATGEAEDMHEWRKQVKYHLHHVSLLRHAAPDLLRGRMKGLDRLGELLGDHHNLAVLGDTLASEPGLAGNDIETICAIIARQQAELVGHAVALGRQLAVEKPAALVGRLHAFWHLLPVEDGDGRRD